MFHRIVTQEKSNDKRADAAANVAQEERDEQVQNEGASLQKMQEQSLNQSEASEVEGRKSLEGESNARAASDEDYKHQVEEKEAKPMSNETSENQGQRPVDIPGGSPYQRPMAGPAQYGYAGMQSGAMQSQSSGRRLMIGEGITLSGEIEACDHLVVEGTVEAALKGAKILDIAENGVYYGTVEIENATIAGRFEGDIRVDGRLTVKSTGVITGTITYRELAVESGATLDGKIAPLSGVQASSKDGEKAGDIAKARSTSKKQSDAQEEQLNFTAGKATASA